MKAEELFSIPKDFPFGAFFSLEEVPWNWIPAIREVFASGDFRPNSDSFPNLPHGVFIEGPVFLDPSVKLSPNIVIPGPAYIGADTEIRPGAFIRGNVIVGEGCVLGNSCEFKNCLLLDRVQVPHFSYVGDSILGNGSHLGAGVICSNLRLDQARVPVKISTGYVESGLKKLGALVGDGAEVGCNTVLNPGTILGKRSLVYPSMSFGGTLDAETIVAPKAQENRYVKRR
jgi:UDP-N-acetylglucosamine diphosphorylase / glucose-1-phosphate thymidylyltransferase / UDP-N-acetylgalactosamine diphosphorylase / glucosamine-1-phosphate N-acetyltransferase / galactosamine-1-phosphate N-acetyltransferase